jgi:hypothetical protein
LRQNLARKFCPQSTCALKNELLFDFKMNGADKTTRVNVPQWASPPPPPPPYTSTENLASEPITQQPSSSDQVKFKLIIVKNEISN